MAESYPPNTHTYKYIWGQWYKAVPPSMQWFIKVQTVVDFEILITFLSDLQGDTVLKRSAWARHSPITRQVPCLVCVHVRACVGVYVLAFQQILHYPRVSSREVYMSMKSYVWTYSPWNSDDHSEETKTTATNILVDVYWSPCPCVHGDARCPLVSSCLSARLPVFAVSFVCLSRYMCINSTFLLLPLEFFSSVTFLLSSLSPSSTTKGINMSSV